MCSRSPSYCWSILLQYLHRPKNYYLNSSVAKIFILTPQCYVNFSIRKSPSKQKKIWINKNNKDKKSQKSRKNASFGVSFLIKLQVWDLKLYLKRFRHRCFTVNFAKFSRATFFYLWWLLLNKEICIRSVFLIICKSWTDP